MCVTGVQADTGEMALGGRVGPEFHGLMHLSGRITLYSELKAY